jgi:osmotically-inducible protein OsmY
MRIRSAGALAVLLALGAAGCGKKDDGNHNANNSNAAHATPTAAATATPTPVTASEDNAVKNKTEAALSKAGISGVTVEVKSGEVTLKGDVPRAKWPAALQAAHESGAKKVNNQLNEKK